MSNVSTEAEAVQALWDAGVVRVLQHLVDKLQALKETDEKRAEEISVLANQVRRLVELLLERHVALCMGQHRRLGSHR